MYVEANNARFWAVEAGGAREAAHRTDALREFVGGASWGRSRRLDVRTFAVRATG
jgi:hypothetical protein